MKFRSKPPTHKMLPLAALLSMLCATSQAQIISAPNLCGNLSNADGNVLTTSCEARYINWTAGNVTVNQGVTLSEMAVNTYLQNAEGTVPSWVNNGTMTGHQYYFALGSWSQDQFNFTNNGVFEGAAAVFNYSGAVGSLVNNGTWANSDRYYDTVYNGTNGSIGTLTNSSTGVMSTTTYGYVLRNEGTVTSLVNEGMMIGRVDTPAIYNAGRIVTLENLQGGATPLTYSGNLPENYNVIIRSPSQYGKLVVQQGQFEQRSATVLLGPPAPSMGPSPGPTPVPDPTPFGTVRFGIAQGSTVASTTYTDVLSGLSAADLGNALTGNYNGFRWALSDADNNQVWDLILSLNAVATSAVAPRASVASGAAAVIDANSALLDLFSNVQSDATMLSTAVTQTLPFLAGGSTNLTQGAMSRINQVIQGRLDANRGASAGNSYFGNGTIWFKPFGGKAIQGDVGGTPGYKANLYGLSGGIEGDASPATRLGLAYAYAQNDMGGRGATSPQSGQTLVRQIIGYGMHNLDDRTSLDFQVDLGMNSNTTRRFMAFAGATATASYESSTTHVGLGVQRSYSLAEGFKVSPFARIDYTLIEDDAYTENGAGLLNLSVAAKRTESYVSTLGASLQRALNERSSLVARAGIGYDHSHGKGVLTAAYAGAPTASFTTSGALPSPWLATLGLGLNWRTLGGPELLTQYDLELREKFTNQTVSVKLRWVF